MRRITSRRGMLVSIGLLVTVSVAACTASKTPGSAEPDNGHTATATVVLSPAAATPSVTPGATTASVTPSAASASSAPPASAWLAASEIPFGATYSWSLDTGNANSAPIGTAEGNGVFYVSPDTVFQAITSCGSPSLVLSTPLGARQRLFDPTSGENLTVDSSSAGTVPSETDTSKVAEQQDAVATPAEQEGKTEA